METNKINRNVTIAIVGTIILLIGVIGLTFAYFMSRASSNNFSVNSGGANINFDGGNTVTASKMVPIEEADITTKAVKKTFSMSKPSGSEDLYAKINLEVTSISTGLKDYDFKWALYEGTTKITTGTFASLDDTNIINLANNVLIDSTTDKNYSLYLWIQETNQEQSIDLMNGTLKAKVIVTSSKSMSNTLASKILGNNNSNVLSGEYNYSTDFTCNGSFQVSCTANYTSGLYSQQDDSTKSNYGFPTYYYRGDVTNNYVQFGKYTKSITNKIYSGTTGTNTVVANSGDDILWRIVRINEDGTIRLINENNIGTDQIFDSSFTSYKNSSIKSTLDTWFSTSTNLSSNSNIANGIFCSDTSGIDFQNYIDGNAKQRIDTDRIPIFNCLNGGEAISDKLGLITADEVLYSGLLSRAFNVTNNISYINNSTYFWTMTPSSWLGAALGTPKLSAQIINFYNNKNYMMRVSMSETRAAARAVINLKPDVLVASGNGTESSPYVIQ